MFVESANPEFSYCNKEKTHEAGYDAYITGLAFVALASFLGKFIRKRVEVNCLKLLRKG